MSKRTSTSDKQDSQTSKKAKTSSNSATELDICELYNDNDADVTLISSDDVRFKVHSYCLMGASPVFHTMFALGDDDESKTINLTDKNIEYSKVVVLFLDLTYGRSLSEPKHTAERNVCFDLASSLVKYETKPAISHLETNLRLWAERKVCNGYFFLMACERLNNPLLAGSLIEKSGRAKFKVPKAMTLTGWIEGKSSMDMSAWSYKRFHQTSDPWKYALLRATRTEASGSIDRNWKAIGQKFEQILKEVEKEYGSG